MVFISFGRYMQKFILLGAIGGYLWNFVGQATVRSTETHRLDTYKNYHEGFFWMDFSTGMSYSQDQIQHSA